MDAICSVASFIIYPFVCLGTYFFQLLNPLIMFKDITTGQLKNCELLDFFIKFFY